MYKIILNFIFLIFSIFVYSQGINLDSIKQNVQNENSNLFYEKLIHKFKSDPTSLSDVEMENLYYGKFFSKYNTSEFDTDYMESSGNFRRGKYQQAKLFGEKYLAKDPTNSEVIWMVKNGYRKDKKSNEYILYSNQEKKLTDLIFKSGDGKTKETAFKVNSVGEEYYIGYLLNVYLYNFNRKSYLQNDGVIDEFTKGKKVFYFKVFYNTEKYK